MFEVILVAYAAIAMFFLLTARSENRRKGQKNSFASFALSMAWPVLLLMLALHLVIDSRKKAVVRRDVRRPVQFETQKSR